MKRRPLSKILLLTIPSLVLGCSNQIASNPDVISFSADTLVQESFGGLGVEWGAYEDTDKLVEGGWERVLEHMDHLGAARIRLMVSYDWFCTNFDDKGDEDKNNDTWTYNFTNKYALNTIEILEYCQVHSIDVAFGAWNIIADATGLNMMDEVTSDIRWAKITADTLNFLVNQKGFTCIKWFVNTNEPNYRDEKKKNNTYEIWQQGVINVRNALDAIGLQSIGIIGGDTTGFEGSREYLLNIAKNIPDKVGDYGVHLYLTNYSIGTGEMSEKITELYDEVKKLDPGLGVTRQADIWEAGLFDGKDQATDCQTTIRTTNYALRMTNYTIQALACKINGITYWDFDDAMHFMYNANSTTPKEWGMFSSLADATSGKQELRPWYHTSALLCHMFKKGNAVLNASSSDESFRSIASISYDRKQAGFVACNSGTKPVEKTFRFEETVEGDKLYVYVFNASSYRLGEDGYIVPSYVIDGSLNSEIKMTVPVSTALFVSNVRL